VDSQFYLLNLVVSLFPDITYSLHIIILRKFCNKNHEFIVDVYIRWLLVSCKHIEFNSDLLSGWDDSMIGLDNIRFWGCCSNLEKYTILINIFHLGVNNTILVGDVFECELLIRLNVDQV